MSNRSEGRRWKPGQSGNPSGRPKQSDWRLAREVGANFSVELAEAVTRLYALSHDELKRRAKEKNITSIETHLIKIILKGIADGDPKPLEILLSRIAGKPASLTNDPTTTTLEEVVTRSRKKILALEEKEKE